MIPSAAKLAKKGVKELSENISEKQIKKNTTDSCCFVAGTQVLTESGYKNIEDIELGEKLWAKNTDTGEQDWKPVTRLFVEPGRGIYEIKLIGQDGFIQKIEATDDHPFYVVGKGWKQTLELDIGDRIETDGYGEMRVLHVLDEKRSDVTYNFTVADFHTYYVTKRNVLVHNCNKELHEQAELARDNLAAELKKSKHPPAAVVGAYSPSSGKVVAGASKGGGRGCAELSCSEALGHPSDIQFTRAVRPRTRQDVPVCNTCEGSYGRDAFPDPKTRYKSEGAKPENYEDI
ncbi:polymorphic toxin-type HINT domain-containing protein [Pleionea sp. CnH1-48]|uniref:polymorphic toxin-type HINT domain-containing protein n=1 Tax=Pleionea sp. CnH1-48 TaxID=2954494 RepID=UPI002097CF0A|nr:polymorphic toxin-type HINT domain-containing protein [Pleionea sp. CnH1-48]MCO7227503.1 HINT domain-containing protein [Pleionea sp. CnH1-48]